MQMVDGKILERTRLYAVNPRPLTEIWVRSVDWAQYLLAHGGDNISSLLKPRGRENRSPSVIYDWLD